MRPFGMVVRCEACAREYFLTGLRFPDHVNTVPAFGSIPCPACGKGISRDGLEKVDAQSLELRPRD